MRTVLADACYWVGLANRRDELHEAAQSASRSLGPFRIVTTDEVLVEFLNYFADFGDVMRRKAAELVRSVLEHPDVEVAEQTRESFLSGLAIYESRPDKGYSLTDCIAMAAMRQHGLTEVLTSDRHFEQEGFAILLKG